MLSKDIQIYIAGLSDEKLVEYLRCGPEYYQPEALQFAADELSRRNISPEAVERGQVAAAAKIHADLAVEQEELSRAWKIIAFLGGFTAITAIPWLIMFKSASFETHRRVRKRRELWQSFRYGLCCFGIYLVVYAILRLLMEQLEAR
ncbi:MAG: hypothetical protein QM775_06235 [Pirellulales bacterium]